MFGFLTKIKKSDGINGKLEEEKNKIQNPVPEPKPVRAVINGLLYDTSKAEKKFTFLTCNTVKDLNYCSDTDLYITKSGRYFCEQCRKIIPLDEHELKYLLEYDLEKYQEIFGKAEEA